MKLNDLYQQFGTWLGAALELKISLSRVNYWRKRGYIPYEAQLLIEKNSKGKLKARKEDARPIEEKGQS
jgi:hypothetical protein